MPISPTCCRRQRRTKELEALEQSNAWSCSAISADHEWFRYHLLADMLFATGCWWTIQERLSAPELHRRAAQWFAARGEAVEADPARIRNSNWPLVGQLMVAGARGRRFQPNGRLSLHSSSGAPQHVRLGAELRSPPRCAASLPRTTPASRPCPPCARHGRPTRGSRQRPSRRSFRCGHRRRRMSGGCCSLLVATTPVLESLSDLCDLQEAPPRRCRAPALSDLGVALVWFQAHGQARTPPNVARRSRR